MTLRGENGVRYTVPSAIDTDRMDEMLTVRFRVGEVYKDSFVSVYIGDTRVQHRKKRIMAPGEMEQVILQKKQLAQYPDADTVTLCIENE